MRQALRLAQCAADLGEVPVGAVVVLDEQIVGEGYNHPIAASDMTAHAEVIALRDAAQRKVNYRLPGATLYVTLEPCTMCLGALMHARIERLVYATAEPKAGALESHLMLHQAEHWNHRIEVQAGILAEESAAMIQTFFKDRRRLKSALHADDSPI